MKKNIIPFLEMVIIVPLACLISSSLLQCALTCVALMVDTCFIMRTWNIREHLLAQYTKHGRGEIVSIQVYGLRSNSQ